METAAASIRLLVIDIDGTLLTPEGTITAPILAAVQAVQQAGKVVTLATARRYCNTLQIANELGLDTPLILYHGALIVQHPLPTVTPAPTTTLTPTATPTLAPGVAAFVRGKARLGRVNRLRRYLQDGRLTASNSKLTCQW